MSERDLYWAIHSAQAQGISVEKWFEMARETWREVRAEMTASENRKLAEVNP